MAPPIVVVELPHVGESVTEGIIGKWLKQPGERVEKYDPLVEVVTDKVSMEVPSPYAGTLRKTLVSEGDTVPMGQPIAEMEVEDVAPASRDAASEGQASARPEPASSPARPEPVEGRSEASSAPAPRNFEFMDAVRSVGPTGSGEGGQGRRDAVYEVDKESGTVRFGDGIRGRTPVVAKRTTASYRPGAGAGGQLFLAPLVRRLVAQHGIDPIRVKGTGKGGRITKADVLRHAKEQGHKAAQVLGADVGEEQAPVHPSTGSGRTDSVHTTILPLTTLRRAIADRLTRSVREIPAAWTMVEADVTGLVRWRDANKDAFQRSHGVPLTYLPVAAHAVAQGLREHPRLNAQWDNDRILLHNRVHLGIAVSTDAGLIVPVVHDADRLSVAELAQGIAELAEAARTQSLKLEDVQQGTFTLNNTGALGSVISVPIINHPQAAILTTEAIVKRPVVVEGDAIAVRSIMNLCLTFDHRVCDGAEAAAFLRTVKSKIEAIDEHTPLG